MNFPKTDTFNSEMIQSLADAIATLDRAIDQARALRLRNRTLMRLVGAPPLCERALGHLDDPPAAGPDTDPVAADIDAEMGSYVPSPTRKGRAWVRQWFSKRTGQ